MTGNAEALRQIAGELEGGKGLLEAFVPMPEKYRDTVSGSPSVTADDGKTWYEWQLENWGCKWGDSELRVELVGDKLTLSFQTPWGPPAEGLLAISRQFPELTLVDEWDEESPSHGVLRISGGELEWSVTR